MKNILEIITVTKDDFAGVSSTVQSTLKLRVGNEIGQIIVDSSNKEIRDKIRELINAEHNIEYIWQEPSGIARAFNLGLSASKAEWVWFLNGRDEVHPDLDPQNFLHILKASKADAMIFELERMQSRTRYKHPPLWAVWPPVFFWTPHPATIVRRQLFARYGVFNEKFKIAMDGEIWFRFFSKSDVIVDLLSLPIALYDESGMSSTQRKKTAKEGVKIILSNLRILLKIWFISGIKIFAALKHFHKESRSG